MKLFVSTATKLLEVDFSTKQISKVIHENCGHYFGIDKYCDEYYFGVRNHDNGYANNVGEILICDEKIENVRAITNSALTDIHQLKFYNGKLYCACINGDQVLVYDGKEWKSWQPMDMSVVPKGTNSFYHINTLNVYKDNLYVGCHGYDRGSIVRSFDKDLNLLNEWKIGSHVHNIFFVNEELHVVSSNTSSIIKESNEVVCDVKFNDLKIYPRGFAETSDHYYLGISLFTVRRDNRSLESSYILQYNKQWKLIDSMELKDTGVLNDMFLK